jgi:protein SCO1
MNLPARSPALMTMVTLCCLFLGRAEAHNEATLPPYFSTESFSPVFDKNEFSKIPLVTFKTFQALDQHGLKFSEKDLKAKHTVLNFFFASCGGICPIMMSRLNALKTDLVSDKNISKNLQFVSISVTPDIDRPAAMLHFSKMQKLNLKNWRLIAGNKAKTELLAQEVFRSGVVKSNISSDSKSDEKGKVPAFVHSESVYLIDGEMKLRGIYNGKSSVEMQLLKEDLAALQ